LANPAATEDIHVIIEGDDDNVRTLPDGNIAVDQPDGGVVVQLNPQRAAEAAGVDDPAKFYANVADRIGDSRLLTLAIELYEAVDADDKSRSEWLSNRADGMELLGLSLQDPSAGDGASAVDGQSVVTNPLLLEAVLKGWANAQAELLPAEGPCKVANQADKASEAQDELGECFQRDMNYYLTSIATEFAPETSHMLLWGSYFGGSGFKKVYTHPLKNRPVSEAVSPEHLIVSDATKDFASCERITHQITMRQSVMKRYQAKGIYRDVVLTPPTPTPNQVDETIAAQQGVALNKSRPEDQPYTLWEIQCELDIEELAPKQFKDKGVPLPYLVTMDKDSQQILAIRRDWKPEDEDCNRKRMYVKYPYVPGPGFYGTGLLNILGNSSAAMTAAWRLALDSAMFASFPSFLLDKLAGRQNTSDFRLSPGTAALIETGGRPLNEVVSGLPYKDPSTGLLGMIDKITQQAKETGGSPDIPVGEGMQNIPVGTMLAHIEQATKVMAAAHKGQHRAMDEELALIADLFRENPESFWKGNKDAQGYWTVERLIEALNTRTLQPKSDPNVPSHIHRVMKAVALVELAGSPLGIRLDKDEVLRRVLSAMREDPAGLILPPLPPQQGPTAEDKIADAKLLEAQTKGKKVEVDAAIAAQKPQLTQMETAGSIKEKTIDLAKALVTHSGDQANAHRDHQLGLADHARNVEKDAVDAAKTTHDAMMDRGKLALEHRKVGLGEAQASHQMGLERDQHALDQQQAGHEMDVGQQKVGIEGAKLGIAQQAADTATHTALHPPKPAGGAKPKKKK
jgi:hypothetical protein